MISGKMFVSMFEFDKFSSQILLLLILRATKHV